MASYKSSLPIIWIIEYLAKNKDIPLSILLDLLEMVPKIPKNQRKNMKEWVAFRCLEHLFDLSNEPTCSISSSQSKVEFPIMETCQNVLQHIVHEVAYFLFAFRCLEHLFDLSNEPTCSISSSQSKVEFPIMETCQNVLQHIVHEIPLSTLSPGRDELLKWNIRPFLMHKRANLPQCTLEKMKDTILRGTGPEAASLRESSGFFFGNEHQRMAFADNGREAPTEVVGGDGEGKSIHVSPEIGDRLIRNDVSGNIDNINLQSNHSNDSSACRFSLNIQRLETNSPYCRDRYRRDDNDHQTLNAVVDGDREGRATQVSPENGERLLRDDVSGNVDNVSLQNNQSNDSKADGFSLNIEQPGINCADGRDRYRLETEPVKDKPNTYTYNDELQNEIIDVSKKKSCLLSSWKKPDLCVKCNKKGQLLVCSRCPVIVHEQCLGSPAVFDVEGNLYCPYCAYTRAITEYLETNKEIAFARKSLADFLVLLESKGQRKMSENLETNKEIAFARKSLADFLVLLESKDQRKMSGDEKVE